MRHYREVLLEKGLLQQGNPPNIHLIKSILSNHSFRHANLIVCYFLKTLITVNKPFQVLKASVANILFNSRSRQ